MIILNDDLTEHGRDWAFGDTQLFYERLGRRNSPYMNHFLSPDTVIPDQTNPQSWNRFSYVNNNPLRYTDPTGHMMDQGDMGGGSGCSDPKYCRGGKPKSPEELKRIREQNSKKRNGNLPFATVTAAATMTPTPSISTLPGQQCTSANPCLNNVIPSATPTATSTTLPLVSSQGVEDAKDLTQYALPSNPLRPNFAPNIDNLWNNLGNALPLINHPAVTSDQIVNSIVDRATKVVEFGANVIANYGQYISSGISPTIPIVPYFPSADPFAPVYQ